MGPALPSSLMPPPPDTFVETEKGNCEVGEKSLTTTSTFSRTSGFLLRAIRPTVTRPLLILTDFTDRSSGDPALLPGADFALPVVFPRLEKFQVPDGAWSSTISGLSIVMPVTFNRRERTRGISSAPTFSDFAFRKGADPKPGSSLIARSPAETLTARIENPRSPTVTRLPSTLLSSDSSSGLKRLASSKNDKPITRSTTTLIKK